MPPSDLIVFSHLPWDFVYQRPQHLLSRLAAMESLINELFEQLQVEDYVAWFYTPLAIPLIAAHKPQMIVYDCMDALDAFLNAPQNLKDARSTHLSWLISSLQAFPVYSNACNITMCIVSRAAWMPAILVRRLGIAKILMGTAMASMPSQMEKSWLGRRVPLPNLEEMIDGDIALREERNKGHSVGLYDLNRKPRKVGHE